ncbi:MAG: hypothetical protein JNM84_19400 [Planctomycetes bacterium]|nr:hypothetical protein [Planctomycetota bacterium]
MLPHSVRSVLWSVALLCVSSAALAQVKWTRVGGISERSGHAMVYEEARAKMLIFGGAGPAGFLNDTWEWDGASFVQLFPPFAPSPRSTHTMAYDAARQRVVLFGGMDANGRRLSDTWEWDGANWTLQNASGPVQRTGAGMTYDEARGRVQLFGGSYLGNMPINDFWEWDGLSWTLISVFTGPAPREGLAMAYDPQRRRTMVVGGRQLVSGQLQYFDDAWEWDAAVAQWQFVGAGFPTSLTPALSFDPVSRRLVAVASPNGVIQTLEWTGSSWNSLTTLDNPGVNLQFAFAYDRARGVPLLSFGSRFFWSINTAWELHGQQWVVVGGSPLTDASVRMAYSPVHRQTTLIAGDGGTTTWAWDGRRWSRTAHPQVPFWSLSAFGFHEPSGRWVRFGGIDVFGQRAIDETWTFDGSSWQLEAPSRSPSARAGAVMVPDGNRSTLLLFGGNNAETWEWNGNDWALVPTSASPGTRTLHAMAFDEHRRRVVLFGGAGAGGASADTWEWDGGQWQQLAPLASPPALHSHGLTYDAARQRVVLFGGVDAQNVARSEHWEFDGLRWTQRTAAPAPGARGNVSIVYDARREQVVMHGGVSSGPVQLFSDTWLLESAWSSRFLAYGTACTASFGTPRLRALDEARPWIGESFTVLAEPVSPAGGALLLLGASRQTWNGMALPFDLGVIGATGCELLTSIDLVQPMSSSGAQARFTLTVPRDPALFGAEFAMQALVGDAGGSSAGFVTTDGRVGVVGTR